MNPTLWPGKVRDVVRNGGHVAALPDLPRTAGMDAVAEEHTHMILHYFIIALRPEADLCAGTTDS